MMLMPSIPLQIILRKLFLRMICNAISGASNCKSYTIPDGDWNVVNFIFSYISPHKFI